MSPDSFHFLITYGVCKKGKYYVSTFFIYTIEYQTQRNTKKIVGERTSTFCVLSCRHDNFYCAGMVIFTVRIIFFGVLRKCYKITVPPSNFYLEFPYSFWRMFFSVYLLTNKMSSCSSRLLNGNAKIEKTKESLREERLSSKNAAQRA